MKLTLLLLLTFFACHIHAQDSTNKSLPKTNTAPAAEDTSEYRDLRIMTPAENNDRQTTIAAEHAADPTDTFSMTRKELAEKGKEDAEDYYKKGGQVFGVTFAGSIFGGPVLGLVPALACSLSFNPKHANFPDYALSQNAGYRASYIKYCKRSKRFTAWGAWASATLIDGLLAGLVVWATRVNKNQDCIDTKLMPYLERLRCLTFRLGYLLS